MNHIRRDVRALTDLEARAVQSVLARREEVAARAQELQSKLGREMDHLSSLDGTLATLTSLMHGSEDPRGRLDIETLTLYQQIDMDAFLNEGEVVPSEDLA